MLRYALFTLVTMIANSSFAQTSDPSVAFEAASIKPFPEGAPRQMSGCMGGPGNGDPARINCEYVSLKMLLSMAYKVRKEEISGPGWLDELHFNLSIAVPHGATREQVALMYRSLLAERFKVELHHETRALPAYSLVVGKSGLKVKESAPPSAAASNDEPPPGAKLKTGEDGFPVLRPSTLAAGPIILYRQGRARLQAGGTTMAKLAEALSNQLDRRVIDETGLTGKYDITLNWTPDAIEPGGRQGAPPSQDASTPDSTLFGALEQQLGLKLVSTKVPLDTLVIDRAEKIPIGN